ncbi:hypothetical protein [Curtobacterium sp. 458]|uniref:hypothetical protein n=1 Tax=Curtobacterium sp. 458 TaxID=3050069 RepID=UPI0025B399AB|nr:hypothetical protein [Curtobacterium sp. 458]WJY01583.1 hypothetical protein QPJ90_07755 [Curtobacterium sp. 458]
MTRRRRAVGRSRRTVLAIVAAALPMAGAGAVTCAWWGRLPARIATTFGPDGEPSGYEDPSAAAIVVGALLAVFLAASAMAALAEDRRKARVACAVTAGFVAVLAVSWVILVGLASSTLGPAAWWLMLAAPVWTGVPYWAFGAAGGDDDVAPGPARRHRRAAAAPPGRSAS